MTMTVLTNFHDILQNGLVSDIFRMERAYALLFKIGENADALNSRDNGNFGVLFGAFESSLEMEVALAVARVYDLPSTRYPTRCFRGALDFLEQNSDGFPAVVEKHNTILNLKQIGADDALVTAVLNDRNDFIPLLVAFYREKLEEPAVAESVERLKYLRDKRIAHNEAAEDHGPTWKSLKDLIVIAQSFVGIVGWAFYSTVYVHNGEYFLTSDAEEASRAMHRLAQMLKTDT